MLSAALLAPVVVGTIGCEPMPARQGGVLRYSEDAKRAYDAAMKLLKSRDYLEAANQFRDVRRRFGFSTYAPLSQLRLADIDYEQEKWVEAITQYKTFLRENPKHPNVAYARMHIARATYNQIGDAPLVPPQDERDQAAVAEAHKEVTAFLRDFPEGPELEQMKELEAEVLGRLVAHELYVARYYLGKGKLEAALARVNYAVTKHHGSKRDTEALLLQAEILLSLKRPKEAKIVLLRIVQQYGKDERVAQAQRYLDEMRGAAGASAPGPSTRGSAEATGAAD